MQNHQKIGLISGINALLRTKANNFNQYLGLHIVDHLFRLRMSSPTKMDGNSDQKTFAKCPKNHPLFSAICHYLATRINDQWIFAFIINCFFFIKIQSFSLRQGFRKKKPERVIFDPSHSRFRQNQSRLILNGQKHIMQPIEPSTTNFCSV